MRVSETLVAKCPPEVVFDYVTDPANLAKWQTAITAVEQLIDGPPGLGTRVRGRTKPPGGKSSSRWSSSPSSRARSAFTST